MTVSARLAAAAFAFALFGGGAALAAEACGCCEKMKSGEPMACCEKMKKNDAKADGKTSEPAPTGHEGHTPG